MCLCQTVWRKLLQCTRKSYTPFQCQKQFPPASNSPWFSLQTPDTPSDTLIAGEAPLCTRHATVNISLMPRNACHRASKWPQGLLLQLHLYLQTYNALFPLNQCRGRSQSHFIGWLLPRHDWIFAATEIVCFWIKCTLTLRYQALTKEN